MRSAAEIFADLKERFEKRVQDTIASGTVLDFFMTSTSETLGDVYKEIEANKNPHLWSSLYGDKLDDMGVMLNIPRKTNEDDNSYRYRIMNWVLTNEASNRTAINNALLNPVYASNIDFQEFTKGSGTATCYIIPKDYSLDTIENAVNEAKEIINRVADPMGYVEYVIPTIRAVQLQIYISVSDDADLDLIESNIRSAVMEYINRIPPKQYLEVGEINRIGITQPNVKYFNVLSMMIDGEVDDSIRLVQGLDSKFLFDEIIWTTEED